VLVLFVWIGAVVVAGVVVAFCAYEISWKSKRLHADLTKLEGLQATLTSLQDELATTQRRMIEVRR
jgi:outer membrane murein-binding lipoprotein Lpp